MSNQNQNVLPPSTKPWAEAPFAAVPGTDEEGRQLGEFMVRSHADARAHDDKLGRPHRKTVRIERQEYRQPMTLAESQARRQSAVASRHNRHTAWRRRAAVGVLGLVGMATAVAGIERALAQDSHSRSVNNPGLSEGSHK